MRRTLAFAAVAALISSLTPAVAAGNSLFGGGPRYDGTLTVEKLTGSKCNPVAVTLLKGYTGAAVYRAKVKPHQIAEAMSIELPMAGALLVVAGGNGSFKGVDKPLTGNFIMDAWPSKVPDGSIANLKFSTSIVEGTENFTFTGTVSNYGFAGCTAKVNGAFTLRVAP